MTDLKGRIGEFAEDVARRHEVRGTHVCGPPTFSARQSRPPAQGAAVSRIEDSAVWLRTRRPTICNGCPKASGVTHEFNPGGVYLDDDMQPPSRLEAFSAPAGIAGPLRRRHRDREGSQEGRPGANTAHQEQPARLFPVDHHEQPRLLLLQIRPPRRRRMAIPLRCVAFCAVDVVTHRHAVAYTAPNFFTLSHPTLGQRSSPCVALRQQSISCNAGVEPLQCRPRGRSSAGERDPGQGRVIHPVPMPQRSARLHWPVGQRAEAGVSVLQLSTRR